MASSLRTSATGGDTAGTGDRTCTITPAVGDLFVVFCSVSVNTNSTPTCSDDNGGTYTLSRVAAFNSSGSRGSCFVRDQLLTNTTSTVVTVATGSNDSGAVVVLAVSGMERTGATAIRQDARTTNQTAGGTPAVTMASAILSKNFVACAVFNGSNPAGMTAPVAVPERQDIGFATPAIGLEVCSVNSGITLTTITWAGTSATAFAAVALELDSNPVDLTADVGTFTESGKDVLFAIGSPAAVGTFSESGQAATFGITTQMDVGAFSESGQAVTFGITNPVAVGSFSESGQDVLFAITSPQGAGSFALAGQSVLFKLTSPVGAGTYLLAGQDANLIYSAGLTLDAGTGSFSVNGQDALLTYSGDTPPTAVITEPGETDYWTGYSYVRVDGFSSSAPSPRRIIDYRWENGEGDELRGPIASFRYDTPGVKTITLTVTDDLLNTDTATFNATIVDFAGPTIYVSGTGNDSNPGTIVQPFRTSDKAFTVAAGLATQHNPVQILFKRNATYTSSAGNQFPCPCIIDDYDAGSDPVITIASGQELYGQRGTTYRNQWGYAVISKDVNYTWAITGNNSKRVGATSKGSCFIDTVITNGLLEGSDGTSDPTKLTWDNVEVSGKDASAGGGGMGISNSGGIGNGLVSSLSVLNCYVHGNSPGLATNVYLHGTYVEIRGNVFDGEGNGVHSAYFSSGMQKYCLIDNVAKNAAEGFGCGSNGSTDTSAEAQDCWFEGNYAYNCTTDGLNLQYTRRARVFNNVFESCQVGVLLNHTSHDLTQLCHDIGVYGNTFYDCGNQNVWTDGVVNVDIRRNILVRTSAVDAADKKFVSLGRAFGDGTPNDYLTCTVDDNWYYSTVGDGTGTTGTFAIADANKTFVQWKTFGFDDTASAHFGTDPLFTNTATHDFHLQSGSTARNTAPALADLYRDKDGKVRSLIDGTPDYGAYEFGGYSTTMTAESGSFVVGSISGGTSPSVRFKIATPVGFGLFGVTGQSVTFTDTSEAAHGITCEAGAFFIRRFNANLIWSGQPHDTGAQTGIVTVIRGAVTFVPIRQKNGTIIYRLGGHDERR